MIIPLIAAVLLVAVDQITKYIALTQLKPIGSVTFIDGFMDFTFVENRGAAFGIFSGKTWLLLVISIIICAVLVWAMTKMPKTKEYRKLRVTFVLILSGAVGNIIDRALRGYVVDFFEFTFIKWPVFNMADIYVDVGTIVMAVIIMFFMKDEKENAGK